MKQGDQVIINPHVPDGTWNKKHTCMFHRDKMLKPGVFTLDSPKEDDTFKIMDFWYDEDWLLPAKLFDVGDKVTIKKNLSDMPKFPHGLTAAMERFEGMGATIKRIFPESSQNIEVLGQCAYFYHIDLDEDRFAWPSCAFDLSNYKTQNNESRLQEQESPLRRGSGEVKCGICCRKHKPRVTILPLSYQKVTGRG